MNSGNSGNKYTGTFFFDPADKIYDDHFPGRPIVPGSVIIHAFMEAGQRAGFAHNCIGIENFRFREFVTPGVYPFSIEQRPDQLTCCLYHDEKILVKGTLKR